MRVMLREKKERETSAGALSMDCECRSWMADL